MIHDTRDVALHHGATQLFLPDLFTDGGLDQMRTGEKDRASPSTMWASSLMIGR